MKRKFDLMRAHRLLAAIDQGQPITALLRPNTLAANMAQLREYGLVRVQHGPHTRYVLTDKGKVTLKLTGALIKQVGLVNGGQT